MVDSTTDYKQKKRCPYCGELFKPKGIRTHIFKKSDENHGGPNNIPDDFGEQTIQIVQTQDNEKMTNSSSRSAETHVYLCHYCNNLFNGERGYKIHLKKSQGDIMHPDDASIRDEEYTLVPADENYDPLMDTDEIYQITERRRTRGDIMDDKF